MSYEVNEEKRNKFMEYAGKRVNNVLHDIQILEPMARSNSYDFTKQDVEEMFNAMQEVLDEAREEFNKKFEEKSRAAKKVFSFGNTPKGSEENKDEKVEENLQPEAEIIEEEQDIEEVIEEETDIEE